MRRLLADLQRGDLDVGVRPVGFEPLLRRLEWLVDRAVLGILAAAFIVGLAVLRLGAPDVGPGAWVGAMSTAGFVLASAIGAYLAWGIARSERRR